jgi:hypothetical protein
MARGRTSSQGRGRRKGKNAKVVEDVESALSVGRTGEEVISSVDGVDELEEEIEEMVDEEIVVEIEESLGVKSCRNSKEMGFLSLENQKSNLGEVSKPKSDWRGLFQTKNVGVSLQYFDLEVIDGNVVVEPPSEVIEEGIFKWSSSLVGQFLDKPFPYYHVKKAVDIIWKQFGKVEVFHLDNGMYIFRFADEATRDEFLSARLWHISNKPLILRR